MKSLRKSMKKSVSWLTIFTLTLIIIGTHFVAPTTNTSYRLSQLEKMEETNSFQEFTNALFCYEVTSDSVTTSYTLNNPSQYQIPCLSPTLTSFSINNYGRETHTKNNLYTILENALSKYNPETLTPSQQITYGLLSQTIQRNKALSKYPYYEELLGNSTGVQANLSVTLGEYPLDNEEDIKIYLNLLTQIPDYFQEIIEYEKIKNSKGLSTQEFVHAKTLSSLKTILEGFQNNDNSYIDTFNQRVSRISSLSKKDKNYYMEKNEKYVLKYVLPAYKSLYCYLNNTITNKKDAASIDKNTAYGLSVLPNGKNYYALLVKQATGSSKTPEALISLTEETLSDALGTVLNTALTDQDTYQYYCENECTSLYQSPEAILETLALLTRADYPALSKPPEYEVKNVSESLCSSLSPAFYMIPAIDNYEENTIYINPLYTNENKGNLFTTLAHEGFPGHLYQTIYFNRSNPDPIRQILNYPGYVEGWATYVELNSYNYLDYPKNREALCQLYKGDTIISLALSSRIDLGVHYEGWTLEDVEQFFEKNGFRSYYAEDLYTYVMEAPANYLSYFIGYLEILQIKEEYKNLTMENYSEKEFHRKVLNAGPCDFETLRSSVLSEN